MPHGDAASNEEHEPVEELLPEDVSAAPQATLRRPKAPDSIPIPLTVPLEPSPSQPATDPYLGKIVADRYLVERLLGLGSMGIVYRCRHTVLDKTVALKIIRQDLAQDDETVGRFMTEARAASAIGSTHIVEVLDFGKLPDGATYLVMEYLEGITLGEAIDREGGLSLGDTLDIGIQTAQALGAAHAIGVVHRDLKPDNVFLLQTDTGWFVKILDFGIAKVMHGGQKLTAVGSVIGTPHYMSPEQATGARTDVGTDIYSLGVMLYEMCCGRVPFDAENPLAVISMQVTEEPQPLRKRMPPGKVLPLGFDAVIHKCLAKDPIDRFASMDDVRAALERIAGGGVPLVAPPSSGRVQSDSIYDEFHSDTDFRELRAGGRRRRWFVRGSLLLLVAGILGGSVYGARYWIRQQTELVQAEAKAAALREASAAVAPVTTASAPVAPASVAPAPAQASDVKHVALIMFPLDARALEGDKDLGMMPVMLEIPKGETKTIHIVRRSYVTRTLKVDGSKPRLVVGLVSEAVAARRRGISQAEAEAEADRAAATSAGANLPSDTPKLADSSKAAPEAAKPASDIADPAKAGDKPAARPTAKSDGKTTLAPNPFGD